MSKGTKLEIVIVAIALILFGLALMKIIGVGR